MFTAFVKPEFHEDCPNEKKVQFNLNCELRCTQPWIQTPSFVLLNNDRRGFQVSVALSTVTLGYYYAEVEGYDKDNLSAGPVFRVPVTVMKPDNGEEFSREYRTDEGRII